MMFWLNVVMLTALVAAVLVWPMWRGRSRERETAAYDLAVYRDQLGEVDRAEAAGTLSPDDAEAARTEIRRRILEADRRNRGETADGAAGTRRAKGAAVAVAVAVPVAAIAGYVWQGNPGMPDKPLASRDVPSTPNLARQQDGGGSGGDPATAAASGGSGGNGTGRDGSGDRLARMEKRVLDQIKKNPTDAEAWQRLGFVRLHRDRFGEAAQAFKRAVEVGGGPGARARYGQALVRANDNTVTDKAAEAFRKALRKRDGMPRAEYYLALRALQQGDARTALDRWRRMVKRAGSDAPWLPAAKRRMAQAEKALGIEPGTTFAKVAPETSGGGAGSSGGSGGATGGASGGTETAADGSGDDSSGLDGPTREQMRAARNMSAEQRRKMIQGMVSSLASKLETNPKNLAGWKRLVRSYRVLNKPAKAREALKTAVKHFPRNVDLLTQYARVARKQGDMAKAVELSRRTLDVAPDHPQALWFVAEHAAKQGNTERARTLFDKALAALPKESPRTKELRRRAERMLSGG